MKWFLLLICFLGSGTSLFAQKEKPDYAVSNAGDTVRGSYRVNLLKQHIMKTDTGKVNVNPTKYRFLYQGGEFQKNFYRSIRVGGLIPATYWFERSIEGPIELYSYSFEMKGNYGGMITTQAFYAIKGDSVVEVFNTAFASNNQAKKEVLKKLLEDESEIFRSFEASKKYKADSVYSFIRRYNEAVLSRKSPTK